MVEQKVKVPVVLAEPTVTVTLDETFDLPVPPDSPGVLEIKTIQKRLLLTQCLLALPSDVLFIKGYVRKDIQYPAVITGEGEVGSSAVTSNMMDYTLNLPFSTQIKIGTYMTDPVMAETNITKTFDFFTSTPLPDSYPHSSKDRLLAGDLGQHDQMSIEFFDELPYCELVSSSIVEYDEYLDQEPIATYEEGVSLLNTPLEEGVFHEIEEKMLVTFNLKVLQKQQVTLIDNASYKRCNNSSIRYNTYYWS